MWLSRFIPSSRREVIILLHLLCLMPAHICEVGKEKNDRGIWKWVLPYAEPCKCTGIRMGGTNTRTPIRPFKLVYVNGLLVSNEIAKIRQHYGLRCKGPELVCPANREKKADPGNSTAVVVWKNPSMKVSSGQDLEVMCMPTSGSIFTIGKREVVCWADDGMSERSTCPFIVTINDTEAPAIICPRNTTMRTDPKQSTAMVVWIAPVSTDNSKRIPNVTCSPKNESRFKIGKTEVFCKARDYAGNSATCSFTVKVEEYWGEWNVWNNCSVTCGYGVQIRNRLCSDPESTGAVCPGGFGEAKQARGYNFEQCPEVEIQLTAPSQSSVHSAYTAPDTAPAKALDGIVGRPTWEHNGCVHTTNSDSGGSWWMADMVEAKCVGRVVIWNRFDNDNCCANRLNGMMLKVGNNKNGTKNPVCDTVSMSQIEAGQMIELMCNMPGRYLMIHLPTPQYLNFCEIKAYEGFGLCQDFPKDCREVQAIGHKDSGQYEVLPQDGGPPFPVYCDMETDGGGWLIFQRRQYGSKDVNRDWDEFVVGFGNVTSEHWLGNEKISRISSQGRYELRMDLNDFEGYAKYDNFLLGNACTNYTLILGNYNGTAGNSLSVHGNQAFSMKDIFLDLWNNDGNRQVEMKIRRVF